MDPSHFRGPQPPAFHIPGNPQAGGVDPHFIIPGAALLSDIVTAIREETTFLGRDINGRFSCVTQGYTEMNVRFTESLRQTDKLLAEQGARFEVRLNTIQNENSQLHDSQTAAIISLKERLDSLEGLVRAVVESVGHSEVETTSE